MHEALPTEMGVGVGLFLMRVIEAPDRPPGVRLRGYDPPAYLADVPGTDVFVTYVVFEATRTVLILRLDRFP